MAAEPIGLAEFHVRPQPVAALDLAALDREQHVVGAEIAQNQLELRAGQRVECARRGSVVSPEPLDPIAVSVRPSASAKRLVGDVCQ